MGLHIDWSNHQRSVAHCFVADQFFLPFTRTKGGGGAEKLRHDKEEGGGVSPKSDDVIQPLTVFAKSFDMVRSLVVWIGIRLTGVALCQVQKI